MPLIHFHSVQGVNSTFAVCERRDRAQVYEYISDVFQNPIINSGARCDSKLMKSDHCMNTLYLCTTADYRYLSKFPKLKIIFNFQGHKMKYEI